jgi:hypothetical protein
MKVISKILFDFTLNLLYITLFDGKHMVCGGDNDNLYDLELMNKLDELEGLEGAMEFGAKYRDMFEPVDQIPTLTGIPTASDLEAPKTISIDEERESLIKFFDLTVEALVLEGIAPESVSYRIVKNMRNHSKENGFSYDLRECKELYDELIVDYVANKKLEEKQMENGLYVDVYEDFESSFIQALKYYTELCILTVTIKDIEYSYWVNPQTWEALKSAVSVGGYYTMYIKGKFDPVVAFGKIDFSSTLRAVGNSYMILLDSDAEEKYTMVIANKYGEIRQRILSNDLNKLLNRVVNVNI